MNLSALVSIVAIGLLATLGQYLLKVGLDNIVRESFFQFVLGLVTSPRILIATIIYVVAFGLYLGILVKYDVSQAFPATIGANIFLIALMSFIVLGEAVTLPRVAGMTLIAAGIYLVAVR